MLQAFFSYVFHRNQATEDENLDITIRVQRKGDHYIKMGEYADLWLGIMDKSTEVAVKVLRGGSSTNPQFLEKLNDRLYREALVWRQVSHPNVSGFHGFVKGWGYMLGLVLPLYQNSVVDFVASNPNQDRKPDVRLEMVRQIAEGLAYLHSKDLVHGDIRGANILMDTQGQPIICDCGLAFIIEPAEFTSVKTAGACRWTAPELMSPSEATEEDLNALFTKASDIYAFAMLIMEIFTGKIPFSNKKNDSSVIFAVLDGGRPEIPSSIADIPALKDLVQLCWDKDPKMRPTSRAVADRISEIQGVPAPEAGTSRSWLSGWGWM